MEIGIEKETIASGSVGNVVVSGVATGFSGLTAAHPYYITDTRGTIGATPGTNVKQIGLALSATDLLKV